MVLRKIALVGMFAASVGCLSLSSWGLAVAGAAPAYGADSCDADCKSDPLVINECRHLDDADACQTDKCTRNVIFRAKCTKIAEGTDCLFTPPFNGTWVTQERRKAVNCTTANPKKWNPHSPGECEWHHYCETRCETGACDGDKWADDLTRNDDVRWCSH